MQEWRLEEDELKNKPAFEVSGADALGSSSRTRGAILKSNSKTDSVQDPCYPPFVGDVYGDNRGRPYPKLAYDGPVWQTPERSAEKR